MERRRGPKEAPVGFSSLRHCGRSSGFRSFLFISFSLIKTNFAYGLRIFFFFRSYFNFISLWSSRNEERNPTQNGGRKFKPSTLSTTFLKKDAITKREEKKIKSFPKRKEQQKNKRSEENIVQKISQMFSRSLSFFSVILYIHILVARRGRSCIKGVLNYRLVPPRLAAATTLRGRPARSEGQAAAIFFCGGRELKCCRLVGSDFCGLFSISFVCFCFFGFISLLI